MKLSALLSGLPAAGLDYTQPQGTGDPEIADIVYDTRRLVPGALFVCIVGTQRDSHDLAAEALAAGAAALVVQHPVSLPAGCAAPVIEVSNTRRALALLSAAHFGHPAEKMTVIGVTGTKGKTTTAHMIRAVLQAAGRRTGIIGTNGVAWGDTAQELPNTTPESYELHRIFAQMLAAGCDSVVMEVSSQGLMMDRVFGIHFDYGIFTNLYPDHIGGPGEHKTFEEYRWWKGQLFTRCDLGIVNADDANTPALLEGHTCRLVRYGMHAEADYRADHLALRRDEHFLGIAFEVHGKEELSAEVNMPGGFSVYNALAAIALGREMGLPHAAIQQGLHSTVVKGRVEMVPISRHFTILIDFAHNESGTESLLTTLRAYNPHRIVCLFGCGGNRSKLRRYGMGEAASKLADFLILTEDNNRFEAVEDILKDIETGIAKGNPKVPYVKIPDRLDAIHYAIDHAEEGDLICVIGKGHETYRDRAGVKTPFLERELIEEYARQKGIE